MRRLPRRAGLAAEHFLGQNPLLEDFGEGDPALCVSAEYRPLGRVTEPWPSGGAGHGAALGVSISDLLGLLSWCAVTGVNPFLSAQHKPLSKQLFAAESYDRRMP
jgi:hypothetical protein